MVEGFIGIFSHLLPWISLIVAGLGILLAYAIYSAKWISAEAIGKAFSPIHTVLSRKYWMDELYEQIILVKVVINGLFKAFQLFDTHAVDGTANSIADGTVGLARGMRRAQTGQLQTYAMVIALGVVIIVASFHFFS